MPGNVRTRTEAALSLNARTAKTKRKRIGWLEGERFTLGIKKVFE